MKKPIVFSLVREQSTFMTIIIGLLTFLSVLTLGIALSIGTGVLRWNSQWKATATIQVTDEKNIEPIKKFIETNKDKIKSAQQISTEEMTKLMQPWVANGGSALKNYLPTMWEVEFNSKSDLKTLQTEIEKKARFLTHATALKSSTNAGWKMICLSIMVLAMTLIAIGVSISYTARNTAMLHRRELEILTQIGASDTFVARQMQLIVAKIALNATTYGFIAAVPVLLIILSTAHSTRIGLMATLGLSGTGWLILIALPVLIVFFAIAVTNRTTIKILKNS